MADPATHSCSILNVTLAEDGIVCPHGFAIREGQEFQFGGQTVTLGPAEPVDTYPTFGERFAKAALQRTRDNDGAKDAARPAEPAPEATPTHHVAVSIYKSLERYGCEGDRTETMRLADALLEDFVIIPKYDLPEVLEQRGFGNDHLIADAAAVSENDVSDLWRKARSFIALALHRDAHPPVDEAQVAGLAELLRTALGVTPETVAAGTLQLGSSDDIARRLIATGRVEVQA